MSNSGCNTKQLELANAAGGEGAFAHSNYAVSKGLHMQIEQSITDSQYLSLYIHVYADSCMCMCSCKSTTKSHCKENESPLWQQSWEELQHRYNAATNTTLLTLNPFSRFGMSTPCIDAGAASVTGESIFSPVKYNSKYLFTSQIQFLKPKFGILMVGCWLMLATQCWS